MYMSKSIRLWAQLNAVNTIHTEMEATSNIQAKTVTFNGSNFANWKFSVSIALKSHNLISIVDGTQGKPLPVSLQ